ncbi:MAG: serine/threonine-protein kinase [Myxococcaceae bacterium]
MRQARQQAEADAEKTWQATADGLNALVPPMSARAQRVAKLENIAALIRSTTSHSDLGELGETLKDARRSEDWLNTPLAGSAFTLFLGSGLALSETPALVETMKGQLERAELAPTGAFVVSDQRLWLVALARTEVQNLNSTSAFVGVAREVTEQDLPPPSDGVALQVVVGGSKRPLSAGPKESVDHLARRRISMKRDESPCCVTRDLVPGVSLAVFKDPKPTLDAAEAEATRAQWPKFGIAGLLSLAIVAVALLTGRKPKPEEDARDALLRETQQQLRQSQEVLQKLSTGAFATQQNAATPNVVPLGDPVLDSTQASVSMSRYEVVAPLGEGGMARVAIAVVRGAEGFKRTFVLKRLKPEHVANVELVNQFIDEARLGASLVHSNIVPIFDFGRDADGYYLAQEYILGRDVDTLVARSMEKRGRPLEAPLVATIGQEGLKALSYAHTRTTDDGKAAGLVHRDVSPANLMVSKRGEVKLLDFGIVKSADRVTHTQAGVVKGNLFYMSPEQARALPVDPRSDLFSLGMVLTTAVLGAPLYDGNTMYELMTRAANGPTAADLERIKAGAGPLVGFLLKALAIDPAARFQTATEMANALAGVLAPAPAMELEELVRFLVGEDLEAERQRFAGAS